MKKFIFILTIFLGSGLLILLSFSKEGIKDEKNITDIDFSEGEKLYSWNADNKTLKEIGFTGSNLSKGGFMFHRFSPVDGIYYTSKDSKPILSEKKGNTNIITFGRGTFICNIQTSLEQYQFRTSDINITPKGRGVFLVDTTQEDIKIFPLDAFLDVGLVNGKTRSNVTNFTLFPSLLFTHDVKNTPELKDADVLRISIIDSIRYLDIKSVSDRKILFSGDDTGESELFITSVQDNIIERIQAFIKLHDIITSKNEKKMENNSFFETKNSLFINESKKEILLKNTLIENVRYFLTPPSKGQYKTIILDTLASMKELDENVYTEGLSILEKYYYVATFSHYIKQDAVFNFSSPESLSLTELEKIIIEKPIPKQGEYYINLTNLFSAYYFLTLKQVELNAGLEKILGKILEKKVLSKSEFLPFSFFVTQYLSTGPMIANEDTMLMISDLFQITNDYYATNITDEAKITTIASTIFYNYTKIFAKMNTVFLNTFIDKTNEGLLLKKDVSEGQNEYFTQNFKDAFKKILNTASNDARNKRTNLLSKGLFKQGSLVTDNYTLLKNNIAGFDIIVSMFNNYPQYLNDFNLNEQSKLERGILIEKGDNISINSLEEYLKKFNKLDISTLQVSNNFLDDKFYQVKVVIGGNIFKFRLWEEGHNLADISYTDITGKEHVFPNITIPLDQKSEQLQELITSSNDPILQYKYDFKNFFEVTFLKGDSMIVTNQENGGPNTNINTGVNSPEIQLFIQKELLDKDFKNIINFLPIGFNNIRASIEGGNYTIELRDIYKGFTGINNSYEIVLSGKYTFNTHSFLRLGFKVKKDRDIGGFEFNDTLIEIVPPRIPLLSAPEILKDIGYYIDSIKSSYVNQKSIVIDLNGKKIVLDNISSEPKFPSLQE